MIMQVFCRIQLAGFQAIMCPRLKKKKKRIVKCLLSFLFLQSFQDNAYLKKIMACVWLDVLLLGSYEI